MRHEASYCDRLGDRFLRRNPSRLGGTELVKAQRSTASANLAAWSACRGEPIPSAHPSLEIHIESVMTFGVGRGGSKARLILHRP
jgi:hypothetical protein